MTQKDLISIVIPAYGHAHFIEGTIRSIIAQSYQNIELIVVNDGSPDNTIEVVESLRKECENRFTRFLFIDKENEGVVKTLNRGLQDVEGQYIGIIASDDCYEPNAIETLHDFLSQNPDYGIAVGNNTLMDDDGKACFWDKNRNPVYNQKEAHYETMAEFFQKRRPDVDFNSDTFGSYRSLLKGNYIPNGYLIRKDLFVDVIGGYREGLKVEDYYLMLQLAKHTKFKYIDKPLFIYRWHEGNTMKQHDRLRGEGEKIIAIEEEYALKHGYKKELYKEKSIGIPYLFQINKKYTPQGKEKTITLLGITCFKRVK